FFFTPPSTTDIYTLSLHDALPIFRRNPRHGHAARPHLGDHPDYAAASPRSHHRPDAGVHRHQGTLHESPHGRRTRAGGCLMALRSEEHTSELQSLAYLVCRLLLEK